ncbi:MAG: hypothetical protein MH208_09355 [Marinobacter sp.]|nr:hypothetical protein [Marinobacter sp.]
MKDLSYELGISGSEISESINRSIIAGLIFPDKKRLMKSAIIDFYSMVCSMFILKNPVLWFGEWQLHIQHRPLNDTIKSEEAYVWPYGKGEFERPGY